MISAGGSALLGCAADPSDPRRRRRQAQQKDLPLPWPPHGGAARRPRRVPHRHGGATGPACLRVVPLSAPHPDPPAPPAHQAKRPDSYQRHRTAAMSASAWLRRTTAGMPGHCAIGAGGSPHRRSTSPPGRSAQGLRPSRLPSPALSSAQSSLCPLRPQCRFRRSHVREDATVRAARGPPVHPAAGAEAARVSPPLFLPLPLSSGQQADEDKVWGALLGAPEIVPACSS